jgi:hypothetical protein
MAGLHLIPEILGDPIGERCRRANRHSDISE